MTYVCELRVESDCEYLNDDRVHCSGNQCCAFCEREITEEEYRNSYVRKERWYEKYYK